ncbi:MAG: hypothetical protein HC905_09720 [Bacteroidales bacterium]|nr:hypothetical protein [Bacteroidales bacterium]
MGYYLDLGSIGLDNYKEQLRNGYLIPSRLLLKENLDERFSIFRDAGIKNVFELQKALRNKTIFSQFSAEASMSEEFLTVLLREINSLQPKPNKIKELPAFLPKLSPCWNRRE